MISPATISELHASEATFIGAMQNLGFGRFEFLQIRGGEVVLDPWPTAIRGVKFGAGAITGRPFSSDSEIRPQVSEFFAYVREVGAGEIRQLEVRHGLPFSMEIEIPGGHYA